MAVSDDLGADQVHAAIEKIAARIASSHRKSRPPTVLGIANGGLEFAKRLSGHLANLLREPVHSGVIDISFYRDDIGSRPIPKVFSPTDVPGEVDDGAFILADDVLQSGRTIRAALEELFGQGRPALVQLAVLVDRGGRTLPIQPDYTGITLDLPADADVKVLLNPRDLSRDEIRIRSKRRRS
jgi:pyrimidine operon attenuation protein/uracil phosphoribosyltransferase